MLTNCHQNLVPPALLTYIDPRCPSVFTKIAKLLYNCHATLTMPTTLFQRYTISLLLHVTNQHACHNYRTHFPKTFTVTVGRGNTPMSCVPIRTPIQIFQRTPDALYHMLCLSNTAIFRFFTDKSGNVHVQK